MTIQKHVCIYLSTHSLCNAMSKIAFLLKITLKKVNIEKSKGGHENGKNYGKYFFMFVLPNIEHRKICALLTITSLLERIPVRKSQMEEIHS